MKISPSLLFVLAASVASSLPAQAKDKSSAPSLSAAIPSEQPGSAGAQAATPLLDLVVDAGTLHLKVYSPGEPIVGAVIVSLSGTMVAYDPLLPPMLGEAALLGIGGFDGQSFCVHLPLSTCPVGVVVHLQGLALEPSGIAASAPRQFFRLDPATGAGL